MRAIGQYLRALRAPYRRSGAPLAAVRSRIALRTDAMRTPSRMSGQPSRRRSRPTSEPRRRKALLSLTPSLAVDLRSGLLTEQRFAAERLAELNFAASEIHAERAYEATFWTLIATKKVLDKIGLSAPPAPTVVQLSDDDHPLLVYRALSAQLAIKVARAETRAIEGRSDQARVDSELETVVLALRLHISNHPKAAKQEDRLAGSVVDTRIIPSRGRPGS